MKIEEILRYKGRAVVTISESDTVLAVARTLVKHNIGSAVVVEGERPVGILTERDILRLTATRAEELGRIPAAEAMTPDPITCSPEAGVPEMLGVMTENRIRHLPITENERLVGIVSIGDLVNASRIAAEEENSHLREYIQGVV